MGHYTIQPSSVYQYASTIDGPAYPWRKPSLRIQNKLPNGQCTGQRMPPRRMGDVRREKDRWTCLFWYKTKCSTPQKWMSTRISRHFPKLLALAFFFLASTLTSARAVLGGFGSKSKTSSASHLQQASVVGLTAATLYQIVTPVGFFLTEFVFSHIFWG